MRTPEDVEFVIKTTLAQYGPEYSRVELIFIPNSLENEWLSGDQLVQAFADIWKRLNNNTHYGFVLSMRRTSQDVSPEYARKVVTDYGHYVDSGIEKLDICADEDAVSLIDLKETLDILITAKQQLTLHVGESTDRDLNFVLDNYPAIKQFNHGIQAAFKPELVQKLLRNNVLLTICPLSNIYTGVLTEDKIIEAIRIFRENGISFTINSDDATIINGDVYAPYKYLESTHPELLPEYQIRDLET
jgi:adenosine deaminase